MSKLASDCPCGRRHVISAKSQFLRASAPTVLVGCRDGAWRVPRIYVAVHKVPTSAELPVLAEQFGWEKAA